VYPHPAIIDLEATGLDPSTDCIIEVTRTFTEEEQHEASWTSVVDPGIPLPRATSAVTGIDDDRVEQADRFEDIAGLILPMLNGRVLVSFNGLRFDVPLLQAELSRCGLELPNVPVLDPMVWAFALAPAENGGPQTLDDLAQPLPLVKQFDWPSGVPLSPRTLPCSSPRKLFCSMS